MRKYALLGVVLLAITVVGVTFAWTNNSAGDVVPADTNEVVPSFETIIESDDGPDEIVNSGAQPAVDSNGNQDVPEMADPDSTCGANFIDEDGDGVCDNLGCGAGNGPHGPWAYGYAEGGCGENFVDEDGDGVCDLMGSGAGNGPHGSQPFGTMGSGCGAEFVDEDGDGQCDLMGSGQGLGNRGRMNGNSKGGGRGGNGQHSVGQHSVGQQSSGN